MQTLQKVKCIVISLSFCKMMSRSNLPSGSAIFPGNMVGTVNKGMCVC